MSEIIEHGESGDDGQLLVGKEDVPMSIKTYQDIYHQITGRTEQIRQRYSENLLVDFKEIEQLNHKIMQLCDVHQVVAMNTVISVFHAKERKEQFTSFERFRAYNSNTTKATVSVALRYNFSILLAGIKNPQEYVVNIRLISRVAMLNVMDEEAPVFMNRRMLALTDSHTAEVKVDYADYVVARSFMEAFAEWIDGCKTRPDSKILDYAQGYSHYIPRILQMLVIGLLISYALNAIPVYLAEATIESLARFFVIYAGAFYFTGILTYLTGRMIEHSIDRVALISYLHLNKGDEKLIEKFSTQNNKAFIKFFIGCFLTVVLGIMSTKIAALL